jgi:hypothetical protein
VSSARSAAALVAALALGCAHAGASGAAFAFPAAFDANQLVTIQTGGETRELIASLRRRGADYDVTLFDPVFAVPILSASARDGAVRVEGGAGGLGADRAEQLLSLLADLYGRTFRATGPDRFEARSRRFAYALAGVRPRDGQPFPDVIEVASRGGPEVRLRVETIDVSGVPPGAPRE